MKYLLIILFLFGTVSSFSQEKEPAGDTLHYTLDQITITATRYPERLIEVPYAVTVLPRLMLTNTKGYGLDEVLNQVPGVLSQSRYGAQDVRIVMRGFGARGAGDRSNSGTTRGIRVMMDGIPETEPDGRTSFDFIDLSFASSLEVIRSNSSALWGNAAGGVINISTVPSFENSFTSVQSIFGGFGLRKFNVQAGTKFGDGKVYASFTNTHVDGWRERSRGERSIFYAGIMTQLSQNARLNLFLAGASNLFLIPGPLTQEQFDSNPQQSNPVYKERDERRYNRLGRIGATLEYSIDNANELSAMVFLNPKYLQRSERNTFRDFTRYHFGANLMYKNFFYFADEIKNSFIAGVDQQYQDGAILFYKLSSTNGRSNELTSNKGEGAGTLGFFLQDEVNFNEKWSLIVGARYDAITYFSDDFLAGPPNNSDKRTFERITPKAGITYRFAPDWSVYANLGGGIEVPAGNETDPAGTYGQDTVSLINPLLDPIQSTTVEIGSKQYISFESPVLNAISYDVALYRIWVTNDIVPYRGGRFYFTAGKSSRSGVELGLTINFLQDFKFQTAFTYTINEYDEYQVDSVHYGEPGKIADYSGNKTAGIPDMIYSSTLTYEPSFAEGLYLSANVSGLSKYFVNDANTIEVPAYNIINLTLGMNEYIQLADFLGVRGFFTVNNLLDEKYAASAFINPDLVDGQPVFLEPGLPRNVVFSLSFKLD